MSRIKNEEKDRVHTRRREQEENRKGFEVVWVLGR